MIYSFDSKDDNYKEFVSELSKEPIDYEVISRDKIVIRIFGHISDDLRNRLDRISSKDKLILKKSAENSATNLFDEMKNGKTIFAGPCSVESESQIDEIARFLSGLGVKFLRGGAFKPRTQSTSFQGLGKVGLKYLSEAAAKYNMKVVTELMDRSQLDDVYQYADIIQVGSRNMFNYTLLTALGAVDKPILFKRGMAATIDEWLHAVDYIRKGGNERIILCERGIRTFENRTRFTLDILAIPIASQLSGLPIIADASHAAGDRTLVPPLVKAALAAGADGIMVEVHNSPNDALSDGAQSMTFPDFKNLLADLDKTGYEVINKSRQNHPAKY